MGVKRMVNYLRKMKTLVKNDCRLHVPGCDKISMYSYTVVNGNIEAHFIVNATLCSLYLYDVIYFQESNMFRVFRYSLSDTFDVANVKND